MTIIAYSMSTPVGPELRSQIITAIKAGMPITEAATAHGVTASTIRKWMRQLSNGSRTSATEAQKTRKQIEFLERVILDLVLEQKSQTYKG